MIMIKTTLTFNISEETKNKLNSIRDRHNGIDDDALLEKVLSQYIRFEPETYTMLDEAYFKLGTNHENLFKPLIETYVLKTLKVIGVVKSKNKHSVRAEGELYGILKEMVVNYEDMPDHEKRFISPTLVGKYLILHNDRYKQKHINVIKRVLLGRDVPFVNEYHEKYNLTVASNKKQRVLKEVDCE
jgi:hypothetical protein